VHLPTAADSVSVVTIVVALLNAATASWRLPRNASPTPIPTQHPDTPLGALSRSAISALLEKHVIAISNSPASSSHAAPLQSDTEERIRAQGSKQLLVAFTPAPGQAKVAVRYLKVGEGTPRTATPNQAVIRRRKD